MKKLILFLFISLALSLVGCNQGSSTKDTKNSKPDATKPNNNEGTTPGNNDDTSIGIELVEVPFANREIHGKEWKGSIPAYTQNDITGAFPKGRKVKLSAYQIGKYELSYKIWRKVLDWAVKNGYTFEDKVGNAGSAPKGMSIPEEEKGDHPATNMTWADAIVWCNAATEMEAKSDEECVYRKADGTVLKNATASAEVSIAKWTAGKKGYRLPSQAEWEATARYSKDATNATNYAKDGDEPLYFTNLTSLSGGKLPLAFKELKESAEWEKMKAEQMRLGVFKYYYNGTADVKFEPAVETTAKVGSKAANDLGCFDMSGNVEEMCWDWGEFKLTINPNGELEVDPKGPDAKSHDEYAKVVRGANFTMHSGYIAVSCMGYFTKIDEKTDLVGFRLARSK